MHFALVCFDFFVIFSLFLFAAVFAAVGTGAGTAYSVSQGSAADAVVNIPAMHNDLPVTEIETAYPIRNWDGYVVGYTGGFANYTNMTGITIPNSVTSIGYEAFSGCTGLTSVTLGTIASANFDSTAFPGNFHTAYFYGYGYGFGAGTYTRPSSTSNTWTKQ